MTGEPTTAMQVSRHMARDTYEVDPDRLSFGRWSPLTNRNVEVGDICASYSADKIGMHGGVRRPFSFRDESWVCVDRWGASVINAIAYRLQLRAEFNSATTTYAEKTMDCERARRDPNGFYHAMVVTRGKREFVLVGPPAVFQPACTVMQPGLFGDT